MITSIVPFKTVLFQILFLLVAISVESSFFHKFLQYSRKSSLEYAISMNLFATIVGWLIFFIVIPFTALEIQIKLMDFIFLNKVFAIFNILAISTILGLFVSLLFLKYVMFVGLKRIQTFSLEPKIDIYQKSQPIFTTKIKPKRKNRVIIWGHTCSHAIILLILLIINWKSQ